MFASLADYLIRLRLSCSLHRFLDGWLRTRDRCPGGYRTSNSILKQGTMAALTRIRSATMSDARQIAPLLGELGYPASSEEVVLRLDRLEKNGNCLVLVAERENEVVGLVTGHVFSSIHATETVAWLTSLVVRGSCNGLGVGGELVAAIEKWARQNGAVKISVSSGNHRAGAHKFYQRRGYESSGIRFTKVLLQSP